MDFRFGTCGTFNEIVSVFSMNGMMANPRQRMFRHGLALLGCLAFAAVGSAPAAEKSIRLQDVSGEWSEPLSAKDAKAIVFIFVSIDCPIANSYAPKLRRMNEALAPKGAVFRLVYPNEDEDASKIKKHLAEYDLPFIAYRDPRHELVRAARVSVTPEAAVYVPGKGWVYRGRIDNRYVALGKMRPAATQEDLQDAVSATLAGQAVKVASTHAVGCSIPSLP